MGSSFQVFVEHQRYVNLYKRKLALIEQEQPAFRLFYSHISASRIVADLPFLGDHPLSGLCEFLAGEERTPRQGLMASGSSARNGADIDGSEIVVHVAGMRKWSRRRRLKNRPGRQNEGPESTTTWLVRIQSPWRRAADRIERRWRKWSPFETGTDEKSSRAGGVRMNIRVLTMSENEKNPLKATMKDCKVVTNDILLELEEMDRQCALDDILNYRSEAEQKLQNTAHAGNKGSPKISQMDVNHSSKGCQQRYQGLPSTPARKRQSPVKNSPPAQNKQPV
ncbi:hypothetical protein KSP40_PGU019461 [Platanthera guangdongensis]|uniref:Uncharacterized protein n=1 Tax=Platanthera guangdongensis TaxID=2320717 RepID=A0ABR2MWW5_9ASPA